MVSMQPIFGSCNFYYHNWLEKKKLFAKVKLCSHFLRFRFFHILLS